MLAGCGFLLSASEGGPGGLTVGVGQRWWWLRRRGVLCPLSDVVDSGECWLWVVVTNVRGGGLGTHRCRWMTHIITVEGGDGGHVIAAEGGGGHGGSRRRQRRGGRGGCRRRRRRVAKRKTKT